VVQRSPDRGAVAWGGSRGTVREIFVVHLNKKEKVIKKRLSPKEKIKKNIPLAGRGRFRELDVKTAGLVSTKRGRTAGKPSRDCGATKRVGPQQDRKKKERCWVKSLEGLVCPPRKKEYKTPRKRTPYSTCTRWHAKKKKIMPQNNKQKPDRATREM